jgi:hypothetical protein
MFSLSSICGKPSLCLTPQAPLLDPLVKLAFSFVIASKKRSKKKNIFFFCKVTLYAANFPERTPKEGRETRYFRSFIVVPNNKERARRAVRCKFSGFFVVDSESLLFFTGIHFPFLIIGPVASPTVEVTIKDVILGASYEFLQTNFVDKSYKELVS